MREKEYEGVVRQQGDLTQWSRKWREDGEKVGRGQISRPAAPWKLEADVTLQSFMQLGVGPQGRFSEAQDRPPADPAPSLLGCN